jgi:hypothetical protein
MAAARPSGVAFEIKHRQEKWPSGFPSGDATEEKKHRQEKWPSGFPSGDATEEKNSDITIYPSNVWAWSDMLGTR